MLQIVHEVDDAATLYWCHNLGECLALERGDGAAIDTHYVREAEIAARIPHTSIRWNHTFHQAYLAGLRGDLAEYERVAEAALSFGTENGEPDAFTFYATQLGNVRHHQGRLHELIPLIEQVLAETPALRVYRAVLVLAKVRAGLDAEARVMLDEDRADGFQMPKDLAWSFAMGSWIDAAAVLGSVEAAPYLRAQIVPYHDQIIWPGVGFEPALCHYLGRLDNLEGRYDDAERWFTEALEIHHRVRSPILVARTQAAWAAMLADRNRGDDRVRARTMAQAALDAAVSGGYGYVGSDARLVLERLT